MPLNGFMYLTVASVFDGRQLGRVPLTWVAPLFAIGLTTLSVLRADLPLPPPWPPWALWITVFSAGLCTLTFAWSLWFGQLQPRNEAAP